MKRSSVRSSPSKSPILFAVVYSLIILYYRHLSRGLTTKNKKVLEVFLNCRKSLWHKDLRRAGRPPPPLSCLIPRVYEKEKRGRTPATLPQHERLAKFYKLATHLLTENDLCKPLSSRTVIPRPLGPVKDLTLTPLTVRRTFLFPPTGYRKETLRSLRLR